jgi:hypothetical protein
MDRDFFDDSFLLTCKTSNYEIKEMIISVLKFSNMLPILYFVTLALASNFENPEVASMEILPVLDFPLKYHMHRSQNSSYGS